MNQLQRELDQALRTVPVGEAPVERVKRDGRRLRTRRRAAVLAGALAVVAVAVGIPTLAGNLTAHKVTPTGSRPVPITDTPPPGTTHAAGGLATSSGVIAQGKVGATPWHVTVSRPSPGSSVNVDFCLSPTTSSTVPDSRCTPFLNVSADSLSDGNPASTDAAVDSNGTYFIIGEAARDVPYLIVTFTHGQQLKLTPVTFGGIRYYAWVAPESMTVASLTAHRGGPYTDNGQTATAIPFDPAGQVPQFGRWLKPGQAVPARVQTVIGQGTSDGRQWSATAYVGPWGTCIEADAGGQDCTAGSFDTATSLISWAGGDEAGVGFGSAAPGVASVRVAFSDGKTAEVKPVPAGRQRLFAFWTEKGQAPVSWTAYNAAGQQVGQGKR